MKHFLLLPLMAGIAGLAPLATQAQNPAKSSPPVSGMATHHFEIGEESFLMDGKPFVYRAGEMHLSRVPAEYWQHRLKMLKSMGMNTVGLYLFWNMLEPKPGEFDWTGMADAAKFCQLAQQENLWVILRPGPYVCAEWDMGGHPWWMLKNDKLDFRSRDPNYLQPAIRYLKEVGRVLAPLQITRGGPIILCQVENEYPKADQEYLSSLRQATLDAGFDVPLIACNPAGKDGVRFRTNYREDLFQTANFGRGEARHAIDILKQYKKNGPYACGEFYPGWFDSWGRKHQIGNIKSYVEDIDYMLANGISFSIYMAHGGTNFGLWAAAAGTPYRPLTTSYDYDAPINEAGWETEKFKQTREVISKHLQPGEVLPDIPPRNPVITVDAFRFTEVSPLLDTTIQPVLDENVRTMETYDQGFGCMIYRTTLPPGPAGDLTVKAAHDLAWIFLDGKKAGVMDRRVESYRVSLPARTAAVTLDILIEALGRPNGGGEMFDRKGLHAPVQLVCEGNATELKNWKTFCLPLDEKQLAGLKFKSGTSTQPAFWRGSFQVAKTGDTFLDFHKLGHGILWINGHCLGRYWNIGPTQTLYCPGPWLKQGKNDVVILDFLEPQEPVMSGLNAPILNELHRELDFSTVTYPN